MKSGHVAGVVVGILAVSILGIWLAYQEGWEDGCKACTTDEKVSIQQVIVDTGTVSRTSNDTGIHFGIPHAQHELHHAGLAAVALGMLTSGGGMVEIHERAFGTPNAVVQKWQLPFLEFNANQSYRIDHITNIQALPDTNDPIFKYHLSITGSSDQPMLLRMSRPDARNALEIRLQQIKAQVEDAAKHVNPDPAQLGLAVVADEDGGVWGLIYLTLNNPPATHGCSAEHECSEYPDLSGCPPRPTAG